MPHPHKKSANITLNQTLNFKDKECMCNNFQGLLHNLCVGSVGKKNASICFQIDLSA
jgi:hypothetical protein